MTLSDEELKKLTAEICRMSLSIVSWTDNSA